MKKNFQGLLPRMRKFYALCSFVSAFLILGISQLADASSYGCDTKIGYVSWYGSKKYVQVADGKVYNHKLYFAASRTLPFGTFLVIKNLRNKKSVVVKIVDRGPFVRGRVLDLSYGAAKVLGILNEGVALVKISPLNCVYAYKDNFDIIKDIIRTEVNS